MRACRHTVLFNCSKTFYVESVHTKCALCWHKVCHGVLIQSLKFCCTKTRLKICSTRMYNAYVILCVSLVFETFILLSD